MKGVFLKLHIKHINVLQKITWMQDIFASTNMVSKFHSSNIFLITFMKNISISICKKSYLFYNTDILWNFFVKRLSFRNSIKFPEKYSIFLIFCMNIEMCYLFINCKNTSTGEYVEIFIICISYKFLKTVFFFVNLWF